MPVTRKRKQDNSTQSHSTQPTKTYSEFSVITKHQALHRQWNRCARCGKNLSIHLSHAHHVIPVRMGNTAQLVGDFMRSVNNCVMLCKPCYDGIGQHGNYAGNTPVSPSVFRYAFGLEKTFHQQWAKKLQDEQRGTTTGYSDQVGVTMLHQRK